MKAIYVKLDSIEKAVVLEKSAGDAVVFAEVSSDRTSVFSFFRAAGKFPLEYLAEEGVLGKRIVLVNPFWTTSWELKIIADYGVPVLLSGSDMAFSGSVFPLEAAVSLGIPVAPVSGHRGLGPVLESILLHRMAVKRTRIDEDYLLETNSVVLGGLLGCKNCRAVVEVDSIVYREARVYGLAKIAALLASHPRIISVTCS